MTKRIQAVYEGGVFKPHEPVALEEGASVELTIHADRADVRAPAKPLKDALAEIASLPLEGPDDGFSGADHDRALYGETDAP